jgi:ribosomal protein L32E
MARENLDRIERMLLLHLLEHRSQQIRFEASQWTTEFGIFRKFAKEDQNDLKTALRNLEMSRMVYRRTQYVVGYSEPKHVFSLTPSGHRKALEVQRDELGSLESSDGPRETVTSEDGPFAGLPGRPSSDP